MAVHGRQIMTQRCYVVLPGNLAFNFRSIDLQTISAKDLTDLIFSQTIDATLVYESHDENNANKELEREDTYLPVKSANLNVKFTLHCSKEAFVEKQKKYQQQKALSVENQVSLPIDPTIGVKRQERPAGRLAINVVEIINNELNILTQKGNGTLISQHFSVHKRYSPSMFSGNLADISIVFGGSHQDVPTDEEQDARKRCCVIA